MRPICGATLSPSFHQHMLPQRKEKVGHRALSAAQTDRSSAVPRGDRARGVEASGKITDIITWKCDEHAPRAAANAFDCVRGVYRLHIACRTPIWGVPEDDP